MVKSEDVGVKLSPWDYKPWWCQPWSIVLTGVGFIVGSWLLLHRLWVTGLVAVPVLSWMGFFLVLWPRLVLRSLSAEGSQAESVFPDR